MGATLWANCGGEVRAYYGPEELLLKNWQGVDRCAEGEVRLAGEPDEALTGTGREG